MKKIISVPLGLIAGFINGLLGTGGGTLIVSISEICGVKPKVAHATALSVILPLTVVSIIMYLKSGNLEIMPAIIVGASGGVGGFTGAKLLKKTPDMWLRILFGITTLVLGITMLFR